MYKKSHVVLFLILSLNNLSFYSSCLEKRTNTYSQEKADIEKSFLKYVKSKDPNFFQSEEKTKEELKKFTIPTEKQFLETKYCSLPEAIYHRILVGKLVEKNRNE